MKKNALLCSGLPEGGTIDVINKKCLYEECDKRPAFSLKWKIVFALLCLRSSRSGTIAVIKKKCLFAGCERRQSFGLEWQKAFALLTVIHKEVGLILLTINAYLKDVIKTQHLVLNG